MTKKLSPDFKIFSLSSNIPLARKIAQSLGVELGKMSTSRFSDGEINVNIDESIRGDHVYVVQSTSNPVNENLMELMIMIDALRRASAKTINLVIPYYGYARQDRKAKSREPITAKLVANMIEMAGADRIVALDLHATQVQGFFDIPLDHLLGAPLIAEYFKDCGLVGDDTVVVAPDHGGATRARKLAEFLKCPIAIIDKRRPKHNVAEVMHIVGDIEGKTCILIDDMIDTAGTIVQGAKALKEKGAKTVYASCTHAILSGPAVERLKDSPIEKLVCTDSIHHEEWIDLDNLDIISVGQLFGEAISRIHTNKSVSPLFYDEYSESITEDLVIE